MTIEESKKFLALIKVAYPSAYKDIDRNSALATVNMWQRDFPSVPFDIMGMALERFRKKSKFPPTVADIYEELSGLYHFAVEYALSTNTQQTKNAGMYIMKHTRDFTDGTAQQRINQSAMTQLMGSDEKRMMIEGGDTDG